jgi:murein DD-endopeptidase MepM/ murein hydrolase activator NlpD
LLAGAEGNGLEGEGLASLRGMRRVMLAVVVVLFGPVVAGRPSAAAVDPRSKPVSAVPLSVDVVGLAGLPVGQVDAVVVNITVVDAGADLFLTAWPSGQDRPGTSNLNVRAGQTRPNLVVSKVGPDGRFNIATGVAFADVLVDLQGWFAKGGGFRSIGPTRLLDSRSTKTRLRAGEVVDVATNLAAGEGAIVNVTGVDPTAVGFITVWPSGAAKPDTSNLNLAAGETAANLAIVGVGIGGRLSFSSSMATDLVVDIMGSVSAADFRPVGPRRLLDSRSQPQKLIFDGGSNSNLFLEPGSPQGDSVVLNVTVVDPASDGFVTVLPYSSASDATSNVNGRRGETTPNLAVVTVGNLNRLRVSWSMPTHLIVDLFGVFPSTSSFRSVVPKRIVDTRAPIQPGAQVRHGFPIPAGTNVGYARTHANYTATDIFAACGTPILSPVDGVVSDVRRVDSYSASNPATFGGRSVAVIGDDGVRYYGSHYDTIEAATVSGTRVSVGTVLGAMGKTGDTTVCHLHFGLSVPCPGAEWSVRRGIVWPWPYLDAWKAGQNLSPQDEVRTWRAAHPTGCWDAMNDPFASSAVGP